MWQSLVHGVARAAQRWICTIVCCAVVGMTSDASRCQAQGTAPEAKTAAKSAPAKEAAKTAAPAKKAKKSAGRLPAHYGDVVNQEQREKIYAIQSQYTAKLDELVEQVKAIKAARDAEIEAVLTAEQKEKLNALKSAAEAKKKSAAAEKTPAKPAVTASAAPAKP